MTQQNSNNRQDIRQYGELMDYLCIPVPGTDLAQREFNKVIRRFQIDRQLGLSYVRLEGEQVLIACHVPHNDPGKQFVAFLTDDDQRVFIAGDMPLTTESEHGQIIPLMMPDPDRPKYSMIADAAFIAANRDQVIRGKQRLDHCSEEAKKIVAKMGTRADDGCYTERYVISYCYFPDLQSVNDYMGDVRSAMQYYVERAIWADDPMTSVINAEEDEHEALWA